MALKMIEGRLPHVFWIDLKNNGILIECAVMKKDPLGNVYFFELPNLDRVDRNRLSRILHDRNAKVFELWDLMSQKRLNNGENALVYFHQLIKMITPSGQIVSPRAGQIGAPTAGIIKTHEALEAEAKVQADRLAARDAAANPGSVRPAA